MRLHLPAIPHTINSAAYSHCAFAGKVLRLPRMMTSVGYEVYHYGVGGSETDAVNIDLLSREEWEDLRRPSYAELYPDREMRVQDFVGDLANVGTPLYREFNRRFRQALLEHYREGDLVCLPFGEAPAAPPSHPAHDHLGRVFALRLRWEGPSLPANDDEFGLRGLPLRRGGLGV